MRTAIAVSLLLAACSSTDPPPADAGQPDASMPVDAGDAGAACVAPSGVYRVTLHSIGGACALAGLDVGVVSVSAGVVTWNEGGSYGCAGVSPDPTLTAGCALALDVTCGATAYHWRLRGTLHPGPGGTWTGPVRATTSSCDVTTPSATLTPR